jgi:hypothetical protein
MTEIRRARSRTISKAWLVTGDLGISRMSSARKLVSGRRKRGNLIGFERLSLMMLQRAINPA